MLICYLPSPAHTYPAVKVVKVTMKERSSPTSCHESAQTVTTAHAGCRPVWQS